MLPPPPSPTSSDPERPGEHDGTEALNEFLGALAADDPDQLYDRAPCGYLTTTPDGLIAKVNQTFLTLTGYGQSDLVGRRRFVDLLTAGGRIYHETHYAPMLQMHGTAREIALDVVCADGRRLPVLVNSVLERDPSGTPTVVRTAVFDATQRRAYERELLLTKQRAEESEVHARRLAQTLQQSFIPPLTASQGTRAACGLKVGGPSTTSVGIFSPASSTWAGATPAIPGHWRAIPGKGADGCATRSPFSQ